MTVTASLHPAGEKPSDAQRGDSLYLEVRDTGPGVPPEDHERIFGAFERGPAPRFTLVDGSAGLGLTLARSYARLLGGDISVGDNDGRGGLFRIVLPLLLGLYLFREYSELTKRQTIGLLIGLAGAMTLALGF